MGAGSFDPEPEPEPPEELPDDPPEEDPPELDPLAPLLGVEEPPSFRSWPRVARATARTGRVSVPGSGSGRHPGSRTRPRWGSRAPPPPAGRSRRLRSTLGNICHRRGGRTARVAAATVKAIAAIRASAARATKGSRRRESRSARIDCRSSIMAPFTTAGAGAPADPPEPAAAVSRSAPTESRRQASRRRRARRKRSR